MRKKITERYKQLRLLITRAKEDAARWGTNKEYLLMSGINETSVLDFDVYDNAYQKFLRNRQNSMNPETFKEAVRTEKHKKDRVSPHSEVQRTRTEAELRRIADALERIADALETENQQRSS